MKKIIVACDSFKGSLSSKEAGEAIREGILETCRSAQVDVVPVSDGGEGLLDSIMQCRKGEWVTCDVTGPLGAGVKVSFCIVGKTVVIEIAQCCGLTLLSEDERNPALTTTYGLGEMIRDALDLGFRRFIIGLGGSATNDAGVGMLQALGYRFLDKNKKEVSRGGIHVGEIMEIDETCVDKRLDECEFIVACDVTNPLIGPSGASRIFGPQKGGDTDTIEKLEVAMSSYAETVNGFLGADFSFFPGAGAAGGLGFAFVAFLGGKIRSGAEVVLDAVGFDDKLKDASLVVTGEGKLDNQTLSGKMPYGVLLRARKAGVPVVAFGGTVEESAVNDLLAAGFSKVMGVTPDSMPLSRAMQPEVAKENIRHAARLLL